ncbi:helix-turn-helix transcriptional regulator, partial [Glutamicibacter sp. AGC13]
MKASRLLHLLLLLQTRQRISSSELSQTLEVSRRTILRDVEALSMAGVPVYAERGRHGGIALLPGSRLNLAHLEPPELEALSVAGLDERHLELLGLRDAHAMAARKVALKQDAAPAAHPRATLADIVMVDSSAWLSGRRLLADIADLATALRLRRQLRIKYRRSTEAHPAFLLVDPYGLVAKSGRWYLVAEQQGEQRLFSLERLYSFEILQAPANLQVDATLRTVWLSLKERTEAPGDVMITARLRATRLDLARRILGERLRDVDAAEGGWYPITIVFRQIQDVRQLLQFADHIHVTGPPAARDMIRALATDLVSRHQDPSAAPVPPRAGSFVIVASAQRPA